MDPFSIGAIIAALAGAALQYKASSDARRRQQQQIQQNLQIQDRLQRQGEQAALDRAKQFAPQAREEKQQQLEQQITDNLLQPVEQAQPAMQDQAKVQGNVSSDYLAASARSQSDQLKSAQALASILGKTMGANRLRTGEALDLAETGSYIDRLHNYAAGSGAAGQIGIQQAGVPNGGETLLGGLLQAGGTAGVAYRKPQGSAWVGDTSTMTGAWAPVAR
jgi:hypothetical protein